MAIAFIGLPVLMLTGALEMECFKQHCSLDVILFLIGMMVVVGGLRDLEFFYLGHPGHIEDKGHDRAALCPHHSYSFSI